MDTTELTTEDRSVAHAAPPVVLVVDDTPDNIQVIEVALRAIRCTVLKALNGQDGLELARTARPDLILLDVVMPGMDGYAVCQELKAREETRDIPVIFVTSLNNVVEEAKGFVLGAVDYIHKPFSVPLLLARVKTHLALYAQRRSLEGMFKSVVEFAPDAFVLTDPQGMIVQVNSRTEQLFGYSRDELIGHPVTLLMPERQHEKHQQNLRNYAQEPQTLRKSIATSCLRKDGTEFPVEISISPLQTNMGPLLMGVVRDTSERQQHDNELRETARYARSLFEASLDPLIMIDTEGKITDVNMAAELMTGLSRQQLIGTDAASKFVEPEKLHHGFQQVMITEQVLDYPMSVRHVSGKATDVLCNASLYRNAQGKVVGVFASARDVTASLQIQRELRQSRQRLRELTARIEAMREEERKHIAREVHDELGQVLTALRIDNALLRIQFSELDPQLKEKIESMKELIDRGIQGVRNVAVALRPAALDMGLLSALEWLCNDASSRIGIPFLLDAPPTEIEIGEDRAVMVFRIVQESITNIARYAQAAQADISLRVQDNTLRVEVRDNGQGFDPDQATAKKSFGLLGMRERALALGGHLDIRSAPGQGTTIALSIPLSPEPEGSST